MERVMLRNTSQSYMHTSQSKMWFLAIVISQFTISPAYDKTCSMMEDILLWWKICVCVKRLTVTHKSMYAHTSMRVHAQCRQKLWSAICFSSDQSRWKRMMICLLPQGQNLKNSFKAFGNLYQVWISTNVATYSECEAFVNIHTHMRALAQQVPVYA